MIIILSIRQRGFSDEALLKLYCCGLKDYIWEELKLYKPQTIEEARHATIIIERKYKLHKVPYAGNENPTTTQRGSQVNRLQKTPVSTFHHQCAMGESNNRNVERKRDGKCWTRRDKYSPGHKCTTQKLYNWEAEQEEESLEDRCDEENN